MTTSTPPRYILDTNILVSYLRGRTLGQWIEATYRLSTSPVTPLISVVTEGELWSLAWQFGWGEEKKRQLQLILRNFVAIQLDQPGVIEAYAEIDSFSIQNGRRMGKNDVWIAAAARYSGTLLLTTDKDFDHLDPQFITRCYIDPNSHL